FVFCHVFVFTVPATTVTYTLSLHDALPILVLEPDPTAWTVHCGQMQDRRQVEPLRLPVVDRRAYVEQLDQSGRLGQGTQAQLGQDRKSTRLNSSHLGISYAVFCLKKKNKQK